MLAHTRTPAHMNALACRHEQRHVSIIIIIMYICHALVNALSAHMIHINLNMIFYTHVEHSPTKTIYIKYYTKQNKNALHTLTTHTHTHARTHALTHARTHAHTHTHTHTHTHSDCSRNWVLVLVRMEILGEEEGFQFGFKR